MDEVLKIILGGTEALNPLFWEVNEGLVMFSMFYLRVFAFFVLSSSFYIFPFSVPKQRYETVKQTSKQYTLFYLLLF